MLIFKNRFENWNSHAFHFSEYIYNRTATQTHVNNVLHLMPSFIDHHDFCRFKFKSLLTHYLYYFLWLRELRQPEVSRACLSKLQALIC